MKTSMKNNYLRTFAAVFSFFMISQISFAQNGPGTTGAVELQIPVNPRAIGMAQAFTAVADDSSAVYWNPAGLNQMQGSELLAEYDEYIETVTYNYLNGAFRLGNDMSIGFGFKQLGTGLENVVDANGTVTSATFGENYYDLDLAVALRLSYSMDFGITGIYISKSLAGTDASTIACTLGLMYRSPIPHLKFAFVVQNLGPGLKFVSVTDPLPLTFKIGAAYQMFDDNFDVDWDVDFPNDNDVTTSLGAEYWYKNALVGRAGYLFQGSTNQNQVGIGGESGLYLGAGIKISLFKTNFSFDYAWNDQGILGTTDHFSLAWYF